MTGIYKITNKINNKAYIGQAQDINKRWGEHKRNGFNAKTHTYNYPLYRAIRKYGLENFTFEVLEETTVSLLTQKEQYYIDVFDTLNPNKGYNQEPAIEPKRGENCNWAILTEEQVNSIINLIQNSDLLFKDIGKMFQISGSCIEDINKGCRWTNDELSYPLRNNSQSIAHRGEKQNTAILSELEVLTIRQRYVEETLEEIFEDYKNKISYAGFKKICYGATWKHLPCYKKRLQKWVYPE